MKDDNDLICSNTFCKLYGESCTGRIVYLGPSQAYFGRGKSTHNECDVVKNLTFQRRQTETLDEIAKKVLNLQ